MEIIRTIAGHGMGFDAFAQTRFSGATELFFCIGGSIGFKVAVGCAFILGCW